MTQMNADGAQMSVTHDESELRCHATTGTKRQRFCLAFICAASAFICVPGLAQAQLYKCIQDGKTVYQQEKCPETAKQSTLRAPDPTPPPAEQQKASEEKETQNNDADLTRIADVVAGFNICSEVQKGFREQYQGTYNEWGTRNRDAFKKYDASPEGAARMKATTSAARAKLEGEGIEAEAKKQALCARIIGIIQAN
jgi:hypothetical protein